MSKRPPNTAPLPDAWWELPLQTRRYIAAGVGVLLVLFLGWFLFGRGGALDPAEVEAAAYVDNMPDDLVASFERLAECESRSDWALNTGNSFYGGLQFTQTSWQEMGGAGFPHEASKNEQIMRGDMLQKVQGWNAWPNCSKTVGLQ